MDGKWKEEEINLFFAREIEEKVRFNKGLGIRMIIGNLFIFTTREVAFGASILK